MSPLEKRSRDEQILAVYYEKGGRIGTRLLALACIAKGVFDEEAEHALLRYAQEQIRNVLKQIDPITGIPRAIPVQAEPLGEDFDGEEKPPPIWVQPELALYEELEAYVLTLFKGIEADYRNAVALRDYCEARFGKAPVVPILARELGPRQDNTTVVQFTLE